MQTPLGNPVSAAAQCLHHIRQHRLSVRADLTAATGLSQPTVTRAVAALSKIGLVRERPDLVHPNGPGRPTIPLELDGTGKTFAGVSVDHLVTYATLVDTRGNTIKDILLDNTIEGLDANSIVRKALTTLEGDPVSVGVAVIHTMPLEFPGAEIISTACALAAAEVQSATLPETKARRTLVCHLPLRESTAALAWADGADIKEDSTPLRSLAEMVEEIRPTSVVLAGCGFTEIRENRAIVADSVKNTELRMIPTHRDTVRIAARAVALGKLYTDPLRTVTSARPSALSL
ncbi:MarR family transcriptional regulator [Corynebacterium sp.]|uniref:MarR family transcriptional regulator n=1 Tax=Corynebacterium sp. TaxID=1720 RepID=UPI0026DC969E|nr:MarR family transcriptional regulator [Corynebacterium sp.]MDO5077672.1 MarR family transcriptional regulator [Corynebacterium sp.]